jgi:DNA-binding SARP family transcriptional activator
VARATTTGRRAVSILAGMTATLAPAAWLRLLGGFELRVGGEVVEVKPAPQRLLALLALADAAVERAFAAGQLWPDACRERAQANLRSTVWRLRDVRAELLTASKTHVGLAAGVWVDVRHGLADPDGPLSGPRPEATLFADLLPDWYDDWLDTERERIRQLRLAGLERRGERLLASGRTADGIQVGLRAVAMEPLRESSHRLVIRCHLAEGNLVEAIRQYDRFAALLGRELGVAPSAGMTDLVDAGRRRPVPVGGPAVRLVRG